MEQKTLYDVVAKIRAPKSPDRGIVRGNQSRCWVFGAATDTLAVQVASHGRSQGVGKWLQGGLASARTLVYAIGGR